MWDVAARALALGTDVILDFGCWARQEREDFRARAARLGVGFHLHYLACPTDELIRRLRARNTAQPPGSFVIREAALRHWATIFEAPTAEELAD